MRSNFRAAIMLALAAVAVVSLSLDANAAALITHAADSAHSYGTVAVGLVLAVGLDALRLQRTDYAKRVADKFAEIKDGLAADAVRLIETDHAALVGELRQIETAITTEETRQRTAPPSPAPADVVAAERQRAADITSLATRHAMPAEFAAQHITAGTAIDAVRTLVLDAVAVRAGAQNVNSRVAIITDEGDTLRAAIGDAILHRANPAAIKIAGDSPAREWRGMSLMEIGRSYHEQVTGQRLRGLGKFELATRLLGLDSGMTRAGGQLSTTDFPAILANVVSKRLRSAYAAAPQNWKLISRQSNAPDFKQKAVTQLSNLPQFKKVAEGGEFQYAGMSDGQEVYALLTYGRIVAVTRQTLINDDMGAFDRLPTLLGRAAAETEATLFWSILTGNPNMNDGSPLFDAAHANLGTAGAVTVTTLDEGRKKMRKQKGLAKKAADAEPLNLNPKFILNSPDKETEVQQFLASNLYAATPGNINPFAGSLQQITEARLSGNAWYLVADPATIDTIEYAYLDGEEGLFTEQRVGFEVDGIEIKGRIDFAAKAIDWRGVFKNAGN